jgi:hypothetical protein
VFDGDGKLIDQFFAYGPSFRGGIFVATGDFNDGLERGKSANIVVSPGSGGPQDVRLFAASNAPPVVFDVTPYPGFGGGITVAETQANSGSPITNEYLVTAPGPLGGPDVRLFEGNDLQPVLRFNAYDGSFLGGVFVG